MDLSELKFKNLIFFQKKAVLIFQEVTFYAQKIKITYSENMSYLLENGIL